MRRETEENYILRANLTQAAAPSKGTHFALRLMAFLLVVLILAFLISRMFPDMLRLTPAG